MPTYRIYEECLVEVIYEVEATSKEEAEGMFMDKNNLDTVYIGETDYIPTRNIDVEERKWEKKYANI